MADEALYYGTGRRKNAVARVRLVPGTGKVTINGRDGLQGDRHHRPLRREGSHRRRRRVRSGRRPASRHLPRSAGGRRLPRRAEEGRLPHARRPYGGAQEVRSEEGPQAPAVLQALSLESRIVCRCRAMLQSKARCPQRAFSCLCSWNCARSGSLAKKYNGRAQKSAIERVSDSPNRTFFCMGCHFGMKKLAQSHFFLHRTALAVAGWRGVKGGKNFLARAQPLEVGRVFLRT